MDKLLSKINILRGADGKFSFLITDSIFD